MITMFFQSLSGTGVSKAQDAHRLRTDCKKYHNWDKYTKGL